MSDNALEILITARDSASSQLAVISTGIKEVGNQANLATSGINNFGDSLVKATGGGVATGLQEITGAIINIGQKSPAALLATSAGFISVIKAIQNSNDAIALFQTSITILEKGLVERKASLATVKDTFIDLAKVFGGIDLNKDAAKNLVSTIKIIEQVAANPTIVKASETIKQFFVDISFNAGQTTGEAFTSINKFFIDVAKVAGQTAANVGQKISSGIEKSLNSGLKGIDSILDTVEKRANALKNVQQYSGYIQQATLTTGNIPGAAEFGKVKEESAKLITSLSNVGQELLFLTYGVQQLTSAFSAPFDLFIGQNIRLQATLLQTQAQIASTNNVLKNGVVLTSATQAIQSLGSESKKIVSDLQEGALKLVGLVSTDLVDQILPAVTQNISQLGGKLGDVPKIVLSLGAALSTLGIPLYEARESLSLIASGTVTVENRLARSLNITNQQVNLWKSQGSLIDNLTKRLQPFVEGNALAAQTIGGVSTNLKDVLNLLTQRSGESFLDVIVKRLNDVYSLVDINTTQGKKNFADIQAVVAGIATNIFNGFVKLADGVGAFFKAILPAIVGFVQVGAKTLGDLLGFIGDTLKTLADGPLKYLFAALGALSQYAEVFTGIFKIGLFLKMREVVFGLAIGGFGLLIQMLPVVSTLFRLFSLRSNAAVLALTNLRGASNTTIASMLTLGKNINVIPGALAEVSKAVPFLGASLGTLIPQLSQIGIAAIALAERFPIIGEIFAVLDVAIPKLIANLARMAIAAIESAVAVIDAGDALGFFTEFAAKFNTDGIIAQLQKLTTGAKLSETAMNGFGKSIGGIRSTVISSLGSFAVSGLLFAGAFALFEKFQPAFEQIGKAATEAFGKLVFLAQLVVEGLKNPIASIPILGSAVLFLAFAISGPLVASITKVIALQLIGYLQAVAGAIAFLGSAANAANIASIGSVIVKMSADGVGALTMLRYAFFSLVPAILAALGPLILLAASVAGIIVVAQGYIQDDELAAEDTNIARASKADSTTNSLLRKSKKSKDVSDKAVASGGVKLSKEQYASNAQLQKETEDQIVSETQRKAGLEEELKTTQGSQQKENLARQINEATEGIDKLKKSLEGVSIAAKDLPRYGSAVEQFARNVENAKNALANSAGDPALFKQQTSLLMEGSQQLQEMGVITAAQAAETYKSIASNASTDAETQIKAQQAITAAYKLESQKRISVYDTQIAKTSALLAQGKISEAEAIALTSKASLDKLKEEEDAITKSYKARSQVMAANTKETIDNANKDKLIADANVASAQGDPTKLAALKTQQLKGVDDDKKRVEDDLNKAKAELNKLEERNVLGTRNDASTAAIKEAKTNVDQLQSKFEKLLKFRGVLDSTIKIDAGVLKDVKELPSQIEIAQKKLDELKKRKPSDTNTDEKAEFAKQVADQEAVVNSLQGKYAKAQSATAPNKANEKSALSDQQAAIDSRNKAEANGKKVQAEADRVYRDELEKQRAVAAEKLAQDQIRILDSQIKTALEVEKIGESKRLIEITKLRNRGVILGSDAKLLEGDEKRKSIDLELSLEQQKLAKFDELEKKGIGVSQSVRRASILKIAELTQQQLAATETKIEDTIARVREHLTLAANQYGLAIDQQNLKLERQKLLYNALGNLLSNQERVAQSTKKLNDSVVAVREADLNVLTKIYDKQQQAIRDAGGTGSFVDLELEEKKKILAEQVAKIKFESLLRQQTYEKESLEREIQKRDLMLEQQKLKNEMDLALKKKDLAIAEVGVKSAEAEVKLRPESPEAKLKLDLARLEQQKKELEYAGLVQERGFLGKTGELNKDQADQERRGQTETFRAQRITGGAELALASSSDADREVILNELRQASLSRTGTPRRLTADNIRNLINTPLATTQGESLADPSKYGDTLRRSEANPNGTLTTEPVKPVNSAFATSFDQLQQKYPDKGAGAFATSFEELQRKYPDKGLGSIGDLNKKYGGKDATTFEELNAKYSGKPETTDPIAKIGSSFDDLNKQIDTGFTKVLVAPTMKVDEMTAGLEAQFNKITTQIKENPVIISLDNEALAKAKAELDKPLKVLDEDQLLRLEGIVAALGQGGKNVDIKSAGTNAASAGATTINAPITVNSNGENSSQDVSKVVNNALDNLLKKVANVNASTK